jgi:anti-sigma-K factor RskA
LKNYNARIAAATQASYQQRLGTLQEQNAILRNDEFRAVALAGTKTAPGAKARVLFNPATKAVYVDVQHLPTLPADKQYQLWALDNGKPVDAGVLATATATGDSLQHMKDIASAQAFAMTVEPVGGSVNPTLSTMTVMGAI